MPPFKTVTIKPMPYHGCHEGGQGGALAPPLESELSSICIGFSLINDVRARGWPPPGKGGPPLENFLVTPMSIDVDNGELKFVLKGENVVSKTIENLSENKPRFISSKLILGLSDQGYADDPKQFIGSFSNMYFAKDDGNIDLEVIVQNLCNEMPNNIIRNVKEAWTLVNKVTIEVTESAQVCIEGSDYMVAVTAHFDFDTSIEVCEKLSAGRMTQIDSDRHLVEVISLFNDTTNDCLTFWTPITDKKEEGKFRGVYTDELVEFLPWYDNMPSGEIEENYVSASLNQKAYFSYPKSKKSCIICDVPISASFTLIGFCKETLLGTILH